MSTARTTAARPAAPPAEGGPSLPDRVAAEARRYRDRGDDLGRFIAEDLERLAQLVAFTGATTPAEHADRMDALEGDRDETHRKAGYAAGYEDGRNDGWKLAIAEVSTVIKRAYGIR